MYTLLANKMTEDDIGLRCTGTLDGNRPTNHTEKTPDDYIKKTVTDKGFFSTQDISSFNISSSTSKIEKFPNNQLFSLTLQLDKRHEKLYAPLRNCENHALLDT